MNCSANDKVSPNVHPVHQVAIAIHFLFLILELPIKKGFIAFENAGCRQLLAPF